MSIIENWLDQEYIDDVYQATYDPCDDSIFEPDDYVVSTIDSICANALGDEGWFTRRADNDDVDNDDVERVVKEIDSAVMTEVYDVLLRTSSATSNLTIRELRALVALCHDLLVELEHRYWHDGTPTGHDSYAPEHPSIP